MEGGRVFVGGKRKDLLFLLLLSQTTGSIVQQRSHLTVGGQRTLNQDMNWIGFLLETSVENMFAFALSSSRYFQTSYIPWLGFPSYIQSKKVFISLLWCFILIFDHLRIFVILF